MGSGVGTSVTYITSGVEVGVTVGGIGVNVGTLVSISLPGCSTGRIPQAPAKNAMRIIEDIIDTCFDAFIHYLTFIDSMRSRLPCTMTEIVPIKSPVILLLQKCAYMNNYSIAQKVPRNNFQKH